jgi:ketosteroid isomerase-like protein
MAARFRETAAQEVQAFEAKRCEALVAGDADALAGLVAEDLVYVHSNGQVEEGYLAKFRSGRFRYRRFSHEDQVVHVQSGLVILIAITEIETAAGKVIRVRSSSVWSKASGAWRQVLWHASPLPEVKH